VKCPKCETETTAPQYSSGFHWYCRKCNTPILVQESSGTENKKKRKKAISGGPIVTVAVGVAIAAGVAVAAMAMMERLSF